MRILIATPILFDAKSPFNHLFKDIIHGFTQAGHEVVRFVSCENETDTGYTLGLDDQEITYKQFYRKKAEKANIIKRYLMDSWMNIRMASQIKKTAADVLFEDVSYSSFWAVRAAKKNGMRVVAMLQDVWPDNAVQSGLIGEGSLLYKFFEMWQRYVYKHADKLICISDDMKAFIVSKGIPEEKIDVIYNWGYSDEIVDIPWEENKFVEKYHLDREKFYAVYAGNIGKMQNVELVVEAAKVLRDDEKIRFLIIGEGVRREKIEKMVQEYGLQNVTMLPMQPSELAVHIYSAAMVNIIPLVPGGVKTAMPSKTGVCLSCGQPVIFAFGEACSFSTAIEKTEAANCVDANDPNALAAMICQWERKRSDNTRVNNNAFFLSKFTRSKNVKNYANVIKDRGQ